MTTIDTRRVNPFVGLRAFRADETALFFGRREQTTQLLERLHTSRFVVVLGYSGSGKSSLVLAGLIPKLRAGFLVRERDHWEVAHLRPGGDPIRHFVEAVHRALASLPYAPTAEEMHALLLKRELDALVRLVADVVARSDSNLLIVIDQFEELFRFRRATTVDDVRADSDTLVSAVLALAAQREVPIYLVLTLRADFVGDCAFHRGLTDAVNRSIFLIPRMTTEELREAVEGPIRLTGASITPRLLERLAQDSGAVVDQLPMVQHALMRTWSRWNDADDSSQAIDLPHYDAIGGVGSALDLHAESVFVQLDSERQQLVETVFKCLTETGPDNRTIRRPATLREVCNVSGVDAAVLVSVIEEFRKPSRSFLMPPDGVPLSVDSVLDISHESLTRNWRRLTHWVSDESASATMYKRIAAAAVYYREGSSGLWRQPELEFARTWLSRIRPTREWAQRYGGDFDATIAFVDASVAAAERERSGKYTYPSLVIGTVLLSGVLAGLLLSWLLF